ncbi:MAG: hypothetical protein ACI8SR_000619 [Oceanicoccus sp.]|jgi:uncharacterized protein YccT (UPF0319 family)
MRPFFLFIVILIQGCSAAQHVKLYEGPVIGQDKEVQLILPLNFELISLDTQPVARFTQTFRNHDLTIKLTPGEHTLVLRYNDVWQLDADNHETLRTGQITFTDKFTSGEIFRIQTPPIDTINQAKQFIQAPKVVLVGKEQTIAGSHLEKENPLVFTQDENIDKVTYPHLKQLQFWWLKASEYEKRQFKQWLTSTP